MYLWTLVKNKTPALQAKEMEAHEERVSCQWWPLTSETKFILYRNNCFNNFLTFMLEKELRCIPTRQASELVDC